MRFWTRDVIQHWSGSQDAKQRELDRFQVGAVYPCWCDPSDPERALLERGLSLRVAFGMCFMAVWGLGMTAGGLGGVASAWSTRGKSRELLTRQAQRPAQHDDGGSTAPASGLPKIVPAPSADGVLPYRLPDRTPATGCGLIIVAVLALGCNGVLSLIVSAIMDAGGLDWESTLCALPFFALGLLLILLVFRSLYIVLCLSPPEVDVSNHPLAPGERCLIAVRCQDLFMQSAPRVVVVCEEIANHDRTQRRERVFEARPAGLDVAEGIAGVVQIPAHAMHSFTAAHNHIEWKVRIEGWAPFWFWMAWDYPLLVLPRARIEEARCAAPS